MSTSTATSTDNSKENNQAATVGIHHIDASGKDTHGENRAIVSLNEGKELIDLNENDDEDTPHCNAMFETENQTMKRDTKRVVHLKILVILILLISASIISIAVFKYIRKSETKQFQSKYYNDAKKCSMRSVVA
jgi:hypothetical protein